MIEPSEHTPPREHTGGDAASALFATQGQYVVVARRYRPQAFGELIGQEHVAKALTNAINTNRVGHAYLFTGARGVGKTSSARILAKALDCVHGPTPTPCNECDICQSISAGSDVDVLEIDGASNRGIDEIRQLRQNVNVRPSRARFKIYIIDEVHMLTKEAFNALLKTLEEPPEHVKFIFCTTEANKIPITILSRCQRFDFAGIRPASIAERLAQIVTAEGVTAEPEALQLLARRANGSMRDSQSLLEQLLSFGGKHLTTADVHSLLGTAGDARMAALVEHLVRRDAAAALVDLDVALTEGVDVGQLLEQLVGYFRDCMVTAVGGKAENLLFTAPADVPQVAAAGRDLGVETILAMIQILDQTLSRLRFSTQGRTLAEMALVRIAHLESLDSLPTLVAELRAGGPTMLSGTAAPPAGRPASGGYSAPAANPSGPSGTAEAKKKLESAELAGAADPNSALLESAAAGYDSPQGQPAEPARQSQPRIALTSDSARTVWQQALGTLGDLLAEQASFAEEVANTAPNRLAVLFRPRYTSLKAFCERPDQLTKLEKVLAEITGAPVRVDFGLLPDDKAAAKPAAAAASNTAAARAAAMSQRQQIAEKSEHPLVRRTVELFGARIMRIEESSP